MIVDGDTGLDVARSTGDGFNFPGSGDDPTKGATGEEEDRDEEKNFHGSRGSW